ncbi:unnamed protein product [Didymodactylos carnosus]|uniref:Uncharacterized protein n=1 Tax=Didymodactylos carnosus TaxID=1234261 RepID=A0A813XT77_9BILA|nr:unnamed protein product [Didymodactylos carnosus]CAF0875104.1 unnamed protein product [Didymodactylos carnosus]CAF3520496.1 unnamed protein product [Didymodactylos carnosus]CAF3662046.1 unnamed protein product [Didymodactylos carnosus]
MALSRSLIFLINILCILLAIAAFLTQFFAVVTHYWKHQRTELKPLFSSQQRIRDDSHLDQRYGLFSRNVHLYSNNDQQMDTWTSTKFPLTNDQLALKQCYSNMPSLRGVILTCTEYIHSGSSCHCARYDYWNAFIAFEITALILLGLVVLISALLTTYYQGTLKPIGIGLSLIAFIFLLVGLILLGTHLKREVEHLGRSLPIIKQRLLHKIGTGTTSTAGERQQDYSYDKYREAQSILRRALKRQTDYYQARIEYNDTHYYQFSEQYKMFILYPYNNYTSSLYSQQYPYQHQRPTYYIVNETSSYEQQPVILTAHIDSTTRDLPALNKTFIFSHSRAWIGWSAILSIISLILSLLYPLLLTVSWLMGGNKKKTHKKNVTVKKPMEYTPVPTTPPDAIPQQTTATTIRYVPTDYDTRRLMMEEPFYDPFYRGGPRDARPLIVRDIVLRDDQLPPPEHYHLQRHYAPYHTHRPYRHPVDRQLPINIDVSPHSYRA